MLSQKELGNTELWDVCITCNTKAWATTNTLTVQVWSCRQCPFPPNVTRVSLGFVEYVGISNTEALVSFGAVHYAHIQKVFDVSFKFIKHKCS